MIDYELLKKLCSARSVSGDENSVRDIILSEIKDCADDIKIDNLGNLIAFKKGKKPAPKKLMLSAHMDEVGLMVTDITSDGFIKFDEVGGLDRRILPGKRVNIGKNALSGVIGIKPVHLTKGDEREAIPEISDMYIDIGADSREEADEVLARMDELLTDYKMVSVADFYDLVGITGKTTDNRYGWTDLRSASVIRDRDGYLIKLPRAEALE